jgi:hypothetical protein
MSRPHHREQFHGGSTPPAFLSLRRQHLSRHSTISAILATFTGLALLMGGCGDPAGKVSGKVTFQGKAVTNGQISLNLKGKGVAQSAKLDQEGAFTMATPMPPGTYHVTYVPPTPEPQDPTKGARPAVESVVPKKYEDLQTTDASVEVKAGNNDLSIQFKE